MTPASLKMSEEQLQRAMLELAKYHGIYVHHCRAAEVRQGRFVTPISGKPGFLDLVLLGEGGLAFRELKVGKNQCTPEQSEWIDRFAAAGYDAGVWREADLHSGVVAETLARLARKRVAS